MAPKLEMETDRRGFLGLISAAVGALALPRSPAAPVIPVPTAKPLAPAPEPVAPPSAPVNAAPIAGGCWTEVADTYEVDGAGCFTGNAVMYNHREEYEGPLELLGFGGRLDGPVIIKERTYDHRTRRTTIKATRYRAP